MSTQAASAHDAHDAHDAHGEHGEHTGLVELAWDAARAAGSLALEARAARAELDVTEKVSAKPLHADLASVVDSHAELLITELVLAARPQDRVLGEEGGWVGDGTRPDSLTWVVDPIDGTLNYLYGRRDWAVSIAAVDAGGVAQIGVVYAPARREAFTASPGLAFHHDAEASRALAVPTPESLAYAVVELGRGGPSQLGALVEALDGRVRDLRRGGCAALALCDVAAGRQDACVMVDLKPWDGAAGTLVVEAGGGTVRTPGRLLVAGARAVADDLDALLVALR